jgi:ABC-2 type transport system permease protein
MTALTYAARDSATMLRRNLRHMLRYPAMTGMLVVLPVFFLLLFVYVFGPTLGAGLGARGVHGGYASYLAPGVIVMTIVGAATATAVSVAMDMTGGVIARFRVMAISRSSVLTGHVLGALIQIMLAMAAVTGVAIGTGFRPRATPAEWVAAAGIAALFALALTWLAVLIGLAARTVEAASNFPMPLIILPFLSSGFVPTGSLPAGIRWFAEYQPFTPVINTLRGLLLGGPVGGPLGGTAAAAAAWSVGIGLACYLGARALYRRDPKR